jgi:peptide/nickel transport system substrate-binding protein
MKKWLFLLLTTVLLGLTGCLSTESDVSEDNNDATGELPTINILGLATSEDDVNILRDQLTKSGFNVELNIQPDFGSFATQRDAKNYDLAVTSWTTVTGNPDYAVRSLFTSDGDYSLFKDETADQLINQAATELPEDYQQTYAELEQHIVLDKAYIAPLYISYKAQGVNQDILDVDSVRLPRSRAAVWEQYDFNDESKRETDPLLSHQSISTLTSLDPIKGNDGSINTLNTNMYVRLVNLTDDDRVVSDGSLSYNYAIGEGNTDYYFILRDDINFAKVENDTAVDSGELVSAEDVVFSLNRAKDRNSVPDHRTYSLHESMETIEVVTDLAELDQVNADGTSIKDVLSEGLASPINALVDSEDEVNNAEGNYQVVKITTKNPFPQVLNYLAHQSAGIVSKDQVERINTFTVEEYDVNTDIAYGDQRTVIEGNDIDNTLYASGPYLLISKNDYEARFVKNPAYMPETDNEPKITEVIVKFIQDPESALSALRNGEIHVLNGIRENRYETVEEDPSLYLQTNQSNGVTYVAMNTEEGPMQSQALRKAVLHSIDQDAFISFYQGHKLKAVSTVSPLVDTGLTVEYDEAKVEQMIQEYFDNISE